MLVTSVTPASAAAQRFGPPDQDYYYKKSDDVQPDEEVPEVAQRTGSVDIKGETKRAVTRRRDTRGNQRKSDLNLKASDICNEQVLRLREKEKLLKEKVQRQEALLHSLQLFNQPANKNNVVSDQTQDTEYADCSQIFTSGSKSSGFYTIKPHDSTSPVRVYCDMSDGGGNYSLRINLEDFDGNQRYAEYKNFKVASEKDHYQLTFGTYEGTAGDALSGTYQVGVSDWASHQGIKFSTYDRDNDNYKGNCAQQDKGGWWFNKCHSAHLNGMYYPSGHYSAVTDDGIVWYTWRGWWYSLKTSIMKLRPTDYKIDPIYDPNAVHRPPPS
ncbi:Fibrinogen-like protein 1 [Nibea albiflora]|uniref:Fibrinogen-like protein 1 n=1 Tax=Nibea albiflora TaxID=240163 RepID=A0ACB7EQ47_NIBAL|nr:Fibrinogen-like protein 1 [Nibea albiflora]